MQDNSSKQQTKQKYKQKSSADGITTSQSCPSEENQINKQINSAQISPYTNLTQTTGPNLGGQKPKGRKNSTLKPGKRRPQTPEVKIIIIMKRQRNTTQMKQQTRNTEVQINEEKIGKLPEKAFRIMIVNIIKHLKTKCRKWKNQLIKT